MPRTEQEILKDFEKIGWKTIENNEDTLTLHMSFKNHIGYYLLNIYKQIRTYKTMAIIKNEDYSAEIEIPEHKLLHELFTVWGWLKEDLSE